MDVVGFLVKNFRSVQGRGLYIWFFLSTILTTSTELLTGLHQWIC